MNEEEKAEFKADIVRRVSEIVVAQNQTNKEGWNKVNADFAHRIEVVLPSVLKQFVPKNNYLFSLFATILNGVVVGLSIYAAMSLF